MATGVRLAALMAFERPAPAEVWKAIEAYLSVAYDGPPPRAVAERLARLRAADEVVFYECEAFEPCREGHALRLGNRFYPHMKLVLEPAPGGRFVFRADTHDRHFLDLVDASQPGLQELIARNAATARAIEEAWSGCGIHTAREDLREQVARRRASQQGT